MKTRSKRFFGLVLVAALFLSNNIGSYAHIIGETSTDQSKIEASDFYYEEQIEEQVADPVEPDSSNESPDEDLVVDPTVTKSIVTEDGSDGFVSEEGRNDLEIFDNEDDSDLLVDEDDFEDFEDFENSDDLDDQESLDDLDISDDEEDEDDPVDPKSPVTLSKVINGVTVEVTGEKGLLGDATKLSVAELNASESLSYLEALRQANGEVLGQHRIYDIVLLDESDNKVQPNGQVEVNFVNLPFAETAEVLVYNFDSDAEIERENNRTGAARSNIDQQKFSKNFSSRNMYAKKHRRNVSFKTNHFSIYAVGTYKLAEYQFYIADSLVTTQIMKNGESLFEPAVPTKIEHKKFIGWYIEGEDSPLEFGSPISVSGDAGTSNDIIKVEARYTDVVYVYFVYKDNIIHTKEVAPGATTSDEGINLVVAEPGWAFAHWSLEKQDESLGTTKPAFDFNSQIDDDTFLYANMVMGSRINFNSQGGSQQLPLYVATGTQVGTLPTPERVGYNFSGWNTKPDGTGVAYTANSTILPEHTDEQGNLDLYAIWNGKQVSYSLVYWQENADDTDYTYKETVNKTGIAGTQAVVAANDRKIDRYPYFSYDHYDTNTTIKGDGSTVVNIYYSRNAYTVRFNLNRASSTLTMVVDGVETTYNNSTSAGQQ